MRVTDNSCVYTTNHYLHCFPAQCLSAISDESVDLVVTSPPYPMISMWDDTLASQNISIKCALKKESPAIAFELMHQELDKVWLELKRVLRSGGIACINVGDATRSFNGGFALYPNHARVINAFLSIGFTNLPNIIWRKQTNAPNKFMGSGMLPAGAYVTLEHEYILIFRKGNRRNFPSKEDLIRRRQSAFFWEERNQWFSDIWQIKGIQQSLTDSYGRERSAAYPFEIPYRLINMFSLVGDFVLDPFLGTGTTLLAALACKRNCIGYEIDQTLNTALLDHIANEKTVRSLNAVIRKRLSQHIDFVKRQEKEKISFKYFNRYHGFPVKSGQETELKLTFIEGKRVKNNFIEASYCNDAASSNSSK